MYFIRPRTKIITYVRDGIMLKVIIRSGNSHKSVVNGINPNIYTRFTNIFFVFYKRIWIKLTYIQGKHSRTTIFSNKTVFESPESKVGIGTRSSTRSLISTHRSKHQMESFNLISNFLQTHGNIALNVKVVFSKWNCWKVIITM